MRLLKQIGETEMTKKANKVQVTLSPKAIAWIEAQAELFHKKENTDRIQLDHSKLLSATYEIKLKEAISSMIKHINKCENLIEYLENFDNKVTHHDDINFLQEQKDKIYSMFYELRSAMDDFGV